MASTDKTRSLAGEQKVLNFSDGLNSDAAALLKEDLSTSTQQHISLVFYVNLHAAHQLVLFFTFAVDANH